MVRHRLPERIKRILGFTLCVIAGLLVFSITSAYSEKIKVYQLGLQPGHYLEWQGKPILLLGDSVTQGWMELGANFNYQSYIDALAARGINVLMLWSYIGTNAPNQIADTRIGYDAPEIWPWVGSADTKDFDLTQLNQAYFDQLKSLVSYAETKGIVVLISVHDGWTKGRFDRHPFNSSLGNGPLTLNSQYVELADYANEMPSAYNSSWTRQQKNQYFQEHFADKLITELKPYSNVIYEMFNEGEWYDSTLRNQHEQHFLSFFRKRGTELLLTNTDHISGDNPNNDTKVDIISMHGGWGNRFSEFQTYFNTIPVKPYLISEPVPGWDGTNVTLDTIRQSVWSTAMAGAGWVAQNDLSFGWDPNTTIAAKSSIRDQAYDYIGYAAKFFNNSGVNFSEMKPQGGLSSTGIALAQDGIEYVVYVPSGGSFTVNLTAATGKTLAVRWYDPKTGAFQTASNITGGSSAYSFTSPFGGDAALHIKVTSTPLQISATNPRYLAAEGKEIYLVGDYIPDYVFHSETDHRAYVDELSAHHINYMGLWSEWTNAANDPEHQKILYAFARTGPGTDYIGMPKFDLTVYDQAYFDKLRDLVAYAQSKGIYVGIILFDAWSAKNSNNAWNSHRFNKNNNVNGIDGDPNGDGKGYETFDLVVPAITSLQEAYVRKVINEVNSFDNVLYEIANEGGSASWTQHFIDFIKAYEATMAKQHLVYTNDSHTPHDGWNDPKTDFISNHCGGMPSGGLKPVIYDSDCATDIFGEVVRKTAWNNFSTGIHFSWFDITMNKAFTSNPPLGPLGGSTERNWLKYLADFANGLTLANLNPDNSLVNAGNCLAAAGKEYIVYLQSGGSVAVNLRAASGTLSVKWFNPRDGTYQSSSTTSGGTTQSFTAPDANDWVLHIYKGTSGDTTQPVISGVSAQPSANSSIITWTTDELATSQVEYGATSNYGSLTTLDSFLVTSHSVTLSGLSASTTYHYRVRSKDAAGNEAVSGDYTFTTLEDSGGTVISNLIPANYVTAYLKVGDQYYIDRSYTITSIPAGYEGLLWIKTANNDKYNSEDSVITFTASQDISVYVAYDSRASSLPNWLQSWAKTGNSIVTSDVSLELYSASFAAGSNISLGGNMASGAAGAQSMYVVLIKAGGGGDTIPPAAVTNFTATAGDSQVTLSWTNPTDADFTGVMIRYRTDTYPTDIGDGTLAIDKAGSRGASDSFVHSGLTNGTTYYYAAFAYDQARNYSATAYAQATPTTVANVATYSVYEITLTSTNSYSNPYMDVTVTASVTPPAGSGEAPYTIEGFWDSGSIWKVRIAPRKAGAYTVSVNSSDPNDTGLNNKTFSFNAVASNSKGFVTKNPYYPYTFMYEDSTPFFKISDTSWAWFNTFSGGSISMPSDAKWQAFVDIRANQGFNNIIGPVGLLGGGYGDGKRVNEGGEPWMSGEFMNKVNPAYFQSIDSKIGYANQKGVVIGLFWDWINPSVATDAEFQRIVRYVIARYAAYNVIWWAVGEYDLDGWTANQINTRFGNIFEQYDPYRHLSSVHPNGGSMSPITDFGNEAWYDYVVLQTGGGGTNRNKVLGARILNKPVVDEEYGYEDEYINADTVRKSIWQDLTAGAGGVHYGHIKLMGGYSGGTPYCDSTVAQAQGALYTSYLANFINAPGRQWWKWSPQDTLVSSGYATANMGEEYVVYLPSGGSVNVDLRDASGTLNVEWYNPRDGTYQGQATVAGGTIRDFTAPDSNDWVLHIQGDIIPSKGDLNSDGLVNIKDIQLCVRVILGRETDPAIIQRAKEVAEPLDKADIKDIQGIVRIILGG